MYFFYHGTYSDYESTKDDQNCDSKTGDDTTVKNGILLHIGMYALADRLALKHLAELAVTNYRSTMNPRRSQDNGYNQRDSKIFSEKVFLETVGEFYSATPTKNGGLREAAVQLAAQYSRRLISDEAELKKVMASCPEFTLDLALQMIKNGEKRGAGW